MTIALAGCGSNAFNTSALDLFNSSPKATTGGNVAGVDSAAATDVDCPTVEVRTGAATLLIGSKPGDTEPSALDVRYQGSIIRTARECKVNAGMMTMKVGIEGRIITGPAGGPGVVDVPLRLAVVQEGINPRAVVSKLVKLQVTIAGSVDRATFTHVDPDITFPLPQPASDIDSYVVYIGFDAAAAQPEKPKPPVKKKPAKPRSPIKPPQT